jgi:hypothetical protein
MTTTIPTGGRIEPSGCWRRALAQAIVPTDPPNPPWSTTMRSHHHLSTIRDDRSPVPAELDGSVDDWAIFGA